MSRYAGVGITLLASVILVVCEVTEVEAAPDAPPSRCGTPESSASDLDAMVLSAASGEAGVRAVANPVTVAVYWHVIHKGNTGRLSADTMAAAVAVLNDSYSGATAARRRASASPSRIPRTPTTWIGMTTAIPPR